MTFQSSNPAAVKITDTNTKVKITKVVKGGSTIGPEVGRAAK